MTRRTLVPFSAQLGVLAAFLALGCGDSGGTSTPVVANGAGGKGGTGGTGGKGGLVGGGGQGGGAGASQGGQGGKAGATNGAVCGDKKKGAKEACDDADFGSATCASVTGKAASKGKLSCFANCTIDASGCSLGSGGSGGSGGGSGGQCGNGKKDGAEACDGAELGDATCATVLGDAQATGTIVCAGNCTLDASGCVPGAGGSGGAGGGGLTCGNGQRDGAEACDGADVGGTTCASALGDPSATGAVACFGNCTLNLGACVLGGQGGSAGAGGVAGSSSGGFVCGNGTKEGAEQCDGSSFGSADCTTVVGDPTSQGALACYANCTIDASACTAPSGAGGSSGGAVCGNGVKEGSETCDGSDLAPATCETALGATAAGTIGCFPNCTLDLTACTLPSGGSGGSGQNVCGDGKKAGTEQCDVSDFGAATCATALGDPTATGALTCFANCTVSAAACAHGSGAGGAGGSGGSGGSGATSGGGGAPACIPVDCQSHTYQCGDCLDNDGDGLVDQEDPECLGPCDNTEKGYFLDIPGGGSAPCKVDCYFDQDTGPGNDQCYWSHECDPHEVTPGFYPEAGCDYDPKVKTPGTDKTCDQLNASQLDACGSFCGPLTPNGCDCFGCCELPAESGNFVWLGSLDKNGKTGTCDLDNIGDPTKCHPCMPVAACQNTCLHCELCLGKTTLPADCLPPPQVCGDGVISGGEQCDGSALGGATCATFTGEPSSTGTLSCASNCTLNGSQCTTPPPGGGSCGDGFTNGAEQCDGPDVGGITCAAITGDPTSSGTVTCNANCTLNASACQPTPVGGPFCGDGVKNGTEPCDGADLGGATCVSVTGNPDSTGTVTCAPNCTLDAEPCALPTGTGGSGGAGGAGVSCGDGIRNGTEQCDGSDLAGATCASVTGNPNSEGTVTCFPNCTLDPSDCHTGTGGSGSGPFCGDQVKNGTEQCDGADVGGATCASVTGNPNSTGTIKCFPNCTLDSTGCASGTGGSGTGPFCGDGVANNGEPCDGTDLDGATCASVTGNSSATGVLKCFPNCTIDSSGCSIPSGGTGGSGSCGGQICPVGKQACGLPCQPPCPVGDYCLTGCCATIVK